MSHQLRRWNPFREIEDGMLKRLSVPILVVPPGPAQPA